MVHFDVPFYSQHAEIEVHIVSSLSQMLDEHNTHAKSFRMTRDRLTHSEVHNIRLRLIAICEKDGRIYNVPTVSKVVALIAGDVDTHSRRDIILKTQSGQLQRIDELHSSYLDGYRPDILHRATSIGQKRKRNHLTMREWFSFRLQCRSNEAQTLLHSRKLFQQFIVEGYPMVESERLSFIRNNQKNIELTSFPACNSHWMLVPPKAYIKRGLPHVHLLLFLHPDNKYPSSNDIDQIISTEIPSQEDDLELYTLVQNHMVHGPCGILRRESPCMKEGKCSHVDGYSVYRRTNNGQTISKNGVIIDNKYIVPYNPKLLRKYQAHINIEWCDQNTSIKYLFKYINKGYDRVTAVIVHDENDATFHAATHHDEIKEYLDCRYISPCEATWRIFGFPIHGRKPIVERLHFHLPRQHTILYQDHDDIDDVLSKPSISDSKFISWMNTNQSFLEGRNLTYAEFVSKFVYDQKKRSWQLRKKGYTIGRLLWVPPTTGELFYLRKMLTIYKGPISFKDIRTIANVQYPTYREACFAMGFLQDDKEFVEAIKEVRDWGTTHYLRKLFALMLLTKIHLNDDHLKILALLEIEQLLQANQKSLRDYPSFLFPEEGNWPNRLDNSLILLELNFNIDEVRSEFL
ncbi:hypothetical protein HKD37_03G007633 [Glycine soja]